MEYIYEAHLNLGQKTAYTVHILHVRHDLKKNNNDELKILIQFSMIKRYTYCTYIPYRLE